MYLHVRYVLFTAIFISGVCMIVRWFIRQRNGRTKAFQKVLEDLILHSAHKTCRSCTLWRKKSNHIQLGVDYRSLELSLFGAKIITFCGQGDYSYLGWLFIFWGTIINDIHRNIASQCAAIEKIVKSCKFVCRLFSYSATWMTRFMREVLQNF